MSRQICSFWLAAFQRTGALKNPESTVSFPPQLILFFVVVVILSGTSGLGLATLQDKPAALCTNLVLPGGVYEDISINEVTDSSYLAFPG